MEDTAIDNPVGLYLFFTMAFLIAGTIKGAVGVGLPTASVGILSQGVDPRTAITLVVIPVLIANTWQVIRAGQFLECLKKYWLFGAVLVAVLLTTTFVTAQIPEQTLFTIIGSVVILFSVTSLLLKPPVIPDRFDRPLQVLFGVIAGLLGGLTAIWAPPLVVYLIGRRVDKEEFVRATGLLIFLGSVPLCIGFWQAGLLTRPLAITSTAMVIPTLAGFTLGEVIRRRLDAERFRTAILIIFLLMGLNLVRRAIF